MRVTGLHLDMKCLNCVIYVVGIMNKKTGNYLDILNYYRVVSLSMPLIF